MQWSMVTVVGNDRPGIVARVSACLFEHGGHLGEASMIRLGGNFTIMLMVGHDGDHEAVEAMLAPVCEELELRLHVDPIEGHLHDHPVPNVRITVFGADRAGIVAQVTARLAETGLNILDLESDVGGSERAPIYVMHIEGTVSESIERVRAVLADLDREGIDIRVEPIETLIG
ncbi:MAG: ACT domain-containing protein [Gammaproteobacteria bacterium]|nr:ACT domain-containing protein [Gammaproteobacteria bacterium]